MTQHSPHTAFQIGEVARQTALSVDAIRFYERRALLPPPMRTPGRFRLYTAEDLDRLRFIRQMQDLGFSLREVKQLVELRARQSDPCASVRELLEGKLTKVRAKMGDLRKLESELEMDLRECEQELKRRTERGPSGCPLLKKPKVRG
jgi:DNA-binding transcriptional MerR regulator